MIQQQEMLDLLTSISELWVNSREERWPWSHGWGVEIN
jgi:hypothetical protein